MLHILRALAAIHLLRIIHRDIKLDNFLLSSPDDQGTHLPLLPLPAPEDQGTLQIGLDKWQA